MAYFLYFNGPKDRYECNGLRTAGSKSFDFADPAPRNEANYPYVSNVTYRAWSYVKQYIGKDVAGDELLFQQMKMAEEALAEQQAVDGLMSESRIENVVAADTECGETCQIIVITGGVIFLLLVLAICCIVPRVGKDPAAVIAPHPSAAVQTSMFIDLDDDDDDRRHRRSVVRSPTPAPEYYVRTPSPKKRPPMYRTDSRVAPMAVRADGGIVTPLPPLRALHTSTGSRPPQRPDRPPMPGPGGWGQGSSVLVPPGGHPFNHRPSLSPRGRPSIHPGRSAPPPPPTAMPNFADSLMPMRSNPDLLRAGAGAGAGPQQHPTYDPTYDNTLDQSGGSRGGISDADWLSPVSNSGKKMPKLPRSSPRRPPGSPINVPAAPHLLFGIGNGGGGGGGGNVVDDSTLTTV